MQKYTYHIPTRKDFVTSYRFGYKNETSICVYPFTYNFIKDVYHEKIESTYILENSDIEHHVQNISFITDFKTATSSEIINLVPRKDKEVNLLEVKLLELGIRKGIEYEDIFRLIQRLVYKDGNHTNTTSNATSEKIKEIDPSSKENLSYKSIDLNLLKPPLLGEIDDAKIMQQDSIITSLTSFLPEISLELPNTALSKEENLMSNTLGHILDKEQNLMHNTLSFILKKEQNFMHNASNYALNKEQSLIHNISSYVLNKESSFMHNISSYSLNKEQNLVHQILSYMLKKEKTQMLNTSNFILKKEESLMHHTLSYDLKKEESLMHNNDISSYDLDKEENLMLYNISDLNMELSEARETMHQEPLFMSPDDSIISKLKEIEFRKHAFPDAYVHFLKDGFLRTIGEIGVGNKVSEYIKRIYDTNNDENGQYTDRYAPKDVTFENLINQLDRDVIRDVLIEVILQFTIRDIIRYLLSAKDEIGLERNILKHTLKENDDTKAVKDFLKEHFTEDLEKYLKIIRNEKIVLEEEIINFLNIVRNKDVLTTSEYFLQQYMDLVALVEELKNPHKEDTEALIQESLLLESPNKNILYTKDTLLFSNRRIVDVGNERQLKLWKRFWFLYAGDEVDRKTLPYSDFPYESEPITFEGNDDLNPENWNVTHPHEFWKKIEYHPVSDGTGEALDEMDLAINIMIEIINVLILMWGKHYAAFWGWTGTQAVLGIAGNVYEWLRLETSIQAQQEKNSKEHYDRCFRWLRWEVEKVSLMAREDMGLRGNHYVGILVEEMVNYMLDHHFNVTPLFEDINKMDEWRRSFERDLQGDIPYVLDKVKGIRHKLIEGKERKANA